MSEVVSLAAYSQSEAARSGERDRAGGVYPPPAGTFTEALADSITVSGNGYRRAGKPPPFFDRRELDQILNLYSIMVSAGEWRDYAIGQQGDSCSFDVFRRSCDAPLYRIVKMPKLARRQGAYSVVSAGGRVLKRGPTLAMVLKLFDRRRFRVV